MFVPAVAVAVYRRNSKALSAPVSLCITRCITRDIILKTNIPLITKSSFNHLRGRGLFKTLWERLIDCMVYKVVLNRISVISQQQVHLSMLSWSSFNQYNILSNPMAAFPHNHCQRTANIVGKGKMLVTSIFSFSHNVRVTFQMQVLIILVALNLSSATCFSFDMSKISFCCKVWSWAISILKSKPPCYKYQSVSARMFYSVVDNIYKKIVQDCLIFKYENILQTKNLVPAIGNLYERGQYSEKKRKHC